MDGHIQEHTAGNCNVCRTGGLGIAGSNLDDVGITDSACCHNVLNSLEVVVESAVETNLIFDVGTFQSFHNLFDLLDVVVDGFLTENVLASLDRLYGNAGVGVCGRTDDNCVDLLVSQNLFVILGNLDAAVHGLDPFSGLIVHERICDCLDLCVLYAGNDTLGMYFADTACADNTNFNHFFSS